MHPLLSLLIVKLSVGSTHDRRAYAVSSLETTLDHAQFEVEGQPGKRYCLYGGVLLSCFRLEVKLPRFAC